MMYIAQILSISLIIWYTVYGILTYVRSRDFQWGAGFFTSGQGADFFDPPQGVGGLLVIYYVRSNIPTVRLEKCNMNPLKEYIQTSL